MKKILFVMILITTTTVIKSQKLIINDTVLKAGIYRTFEEFKYNNPSVELNHKVTTTKRGYGFMNAAGKVTYYRIEVYRKDAKLIGNVFGFCDGENVYINEHSPKIEPSVGFSKIEYFGKYCYYEGVIYSTVTTEWSNSAVNPSKTVSYGSLAEKIIDIYSGEVITLNDKKLREIIADDPELLKEFNKDSNKKKSLKDYIIRYMENKKNLVQN